MHAEGINPRPFLGARKQMKWQFDLRNGKINKNSFVTPNDKSGINIQIDGWIFLALYLENKAKTRRNKHRTKLNSCKQISIQSLELFLPVQF